MTEPTQPEVTLAHLLRITGLDTEEDLIAAVSSYQTYMAIAQALVRHSKAAAEFLRATARIGLEKPPTADWQKLAHDDVLRTLKSLGLEPMTRAEFQRDVNQRAQTLTAQQEPAARLD